jgi:hypothetical protein
VSTTVSVDSSLEASISCNLALTSSEICLLWKKEMF